MTHNPSTILRGWPNGLGPLASQTYDEAAMIKVVRNELLLQLPDLTDDQAWMLAGNIVARFRRDLLPDD